MLSFKRHCTKNGEPYKKTHCTNSSSVQFQILYSAVVFCTVYKIFYTLGQ